jgi:WD40 repeat protein
MAIHSEDLLSSDSGPGRRFEERFDHHRGPVTCVAGIPGTRAAVTSGYDSAVGYVDLEHGRIELLGYHRHLVNRIVVNERGTRAASCSSDYTIVLWDLEKRRPLRTLRGHWDDVEDFAFVDDRTGVSVSRDHRVFIWDLETGAIRRILQEHEKDVLAVAYAKGRIYSSGDDMTLRQWDEPSGELLRTWGPFEEETDTCAIDPLNDRVVLGADDGCIRVFDSGTGEAIATIRAHASGIKKVAVSPTNGDILSAAYDQRIRVWGAKAFDLKGELDRHPAVWERSFNWSPDGTNILAGTFDGTVLLWDAYSGCRLAEVGRQDGVGGNACFNDVSANSAGSMAIVSDDGVLRLANLNPAAAKWIREVVPRSGRMLMNSVTLDDAHGIVLAGAHDQTLHIFQMNDQGIQGEREVSLQEGPVNCVRVAHTHGRGDEAFVACYSGAILRVTLEGEILGRIRVHEGAVKALRLHPRQPVGVSCGADGLLLRWDFDGRLLERFHGHTAIVDDVDLDPSGELIASVSRDFTLKVYAQASGRLRHSIALGHQSPKSVLFWDSDTVVVGNYWGYLLQVDLRNEKVIRRKIAENGISALSRSGDYLVAVSYDGTVNLVSPADLGVVRTLRAMVQKLPVGDVTATA